MSYTDFQKYCASMGVISNPLEESEFISLRLSGLSFDDCYQFGCDLVAGFAPTYLEDLYEAKL
jgi:hypothetical protein